jgi:hypothetical protein
MQTSRLYQAQKCPKLAISLRSCLWLQRPWAPPVPAQTGGAGLWQSSTPRLRTACECCFSCHGDLCACQAPATQAYNLSLHGVAKPRCFKLAHTGGSHPAAQSPAAMQHWRSRRWRSRRKISGAEQPRKWKWGAQKRDAHLARTSSPQGGESGPPAPLGGPRGRPAESAPSQSPTPALRGARA